jgi:hypothetical protein
MLLALRNRDVIYIAVALGVFGTLTAGEVIAPGGTALAVAAEPTLGSAGYWFTNAVLYPADGLYLGNGERRAVSARAGA